MAKNGSKTSDLIIVVLPGDNVTKYINEKPAKLGIGLRVVDDFSEQHEDDDQDQQQHEQVYATLPGRFMKKRNVYYVRQNMHRYRPALHDRVVGIVEGRMGPDGAGGEFYQVNINASHAAVLSSLSFEGATKRNKPNFTTGQLLYARISELHQGYLDPVLSCINGPHDAGVPRKDWMTNEGCYGELRGGTVARISTGLARELLLPDNVVLTELAKTKIPFEVAIGVNGLLWIHSKMPEYTIMIQNAIQNSEVLTEAQVRAMVKSLHYTVQKQLQQEADAMDTDEDR